MTDRPQTPRFQGVDRVARRPIPTPARPDQAQRHTFNRPAAETPIAAIPEERKP